MIWIISFYLLSVILFINILISECKRERIKITFNDIFDYYQFDLMWVICPIVNSVIVFAWYVCLVVDKIKKFIK